MANLNSPPFKQTCPETAETASPHFNTLTFVPSVPGVTKVQTVPLH